MQRRAAAIYFGIFILIGAGAYGFIQVGTSQPQVDLGTEKFSQGDSFQVGGQTYTVSNLARAEGGEGEGALQVSLSYTNASARSTATLANNSTTSYEGEDYRVVIENRSDVSEFTLREVQNVTAILVDDPAVENELATQNGTKYVVYRDDQSLEPLEEYLPAPETRGPFATGESFPHTADGTNVTATIDAVTPSEVTLAWTTEAERSIEGVTEGSNITLGGTQHFVHFVDDENVEIVPTDQFLDDYQQQNAVRDNWLERIAGIWGVVILSFVAAIFLLGAAYMPVKD
jgi:hypothetical protein